MLRTLFISVVIAVSVLGAISQTPTPSPTPAAAAIAKLQAERERAIKLNALITQYNTAVAAKNWADAETAASGLVGLDPTPLYYNGLGTAQLNQGKFEAAAGSFGTALQRLGNWDQLKTADAAARHTAAGILTNQGNAFLKLKRNADAVKAYMSAADLDPQPAIAYFNLCATEYNIGETDAALAACSKVISIDPTRADAYFIKGSLLVGNSTQDSNGKMIAPAGTVEALKKYLELAPTGPHASDVKQMLDLLGAKY